MEHSYVYILTHKTQPRLKIGKANDVIARISQLGLTGEFDLVNSICFELPRRYAFKHEKSLHYLFDQYRLSPFNGDGGTEWFSSACKEQLYRTARYLSDTQGYVEHQIRNLATSRVYKAKKQKPKITKRVECNKFEYIEFRDFAEFLIKRKNAFDINIDYENDYLILEGPSLGDRGIPMLSIVRKEGFGRINVVCRGRNDGERVKLYIGLPGKSKKNRLGRVHHRMIERICKMIDYNYTNIGTTNRHSI